MLSAPHTRPATAEAGSSDGSLSDHIVLDSTTLPAHIWQSSSTEGGRGPQPEPEGPLQGPDAVAAARQLPLPARQRIDISDSNLRSPWARKTVMALDGGGIKGYSSLLILKRLMKLIAEIEAGRRPAGYHDASASGRPEPYFHEVNSTSVDYPWFRHEAHPGEPKRDVPSVNGEPAVIHDEGLEDVIEETSKESAGTSDYLPHHYFDYIAGTSTGGLSALMIGRLRMTIDDALAQYDVMGNQVFGKPRLLHRQLDFLNYATPKYPSRNMVNALLEIVRNGLAEELWQWEIQPSEAPLESHQAQCRTLTISYGHHFMKGVKKDYMFRSYDHPSPSPLGQQHVPHLNPGRAHREPIYMIARATSAAPGYFSPISFSGRIFRDGGMGANNPAERALWEVLQMHEHPPRLLLSLGTGKPENIPASSKTMEKLRRLSERKRDKMERAPRRRKGLIKTKGDVDDVVALATEAEKTEETVKRECCLLINPPIDYYRMNVERGMGRILLDEWLPAIGGTDTKTKITTLTNEYLRSKDVNDKLLQCARALVKLRRDRAKTERWESFATNYIYFCPHPACNDPNNRFSKTYLERKELREHGINEHFAVLGTPIGNGCTYTIACTHDVCVHRVHIFNNTEELRQHFHDHHDGLSEFKSAVEIEAWLDLGRKSQREVLLHRESMRDRDARVEGNQPGPGTITPATGTVTPAADGEGQAPAGPRVLLPRRTRSSLRSPVTFRSPWGGNVEGGQPH